MGSLARAVLAAVHAVSITGLVALVACGGSSSTRQALTPQGNLVTLAMSAPDGCKELGNVSGHAEGADQEQATIAARVEVRNKAGALGADRVVMMKKHAEVHHGESRVFIEISLAGKAMHCGELGREPDFLKPNQNP
jgi:hypothetical protein